MQPLLRSMLSTLNGLCALTELVAGVKVSVVYQKQLQSNMMTREIPCLRLRMPTQVQAELRRKHFDQEQIDYYKRNRRDVRAKAAAGR